jgi:hypothetical protein
MIAALNDALTIKAGVMPSHPHPLAEQVAEMDMKDIAIIAGELTAIEQCRRPTNDAAILGMGLTRSDFGVAMGDAMSYLAANRYDAFADHLPLCADCVFQTKVATDSRRSLPPIPRESCH